MDDAPRKPTPPTRSAPAPATATVGIHATNAWNPTGRNLEPVPGTRLFFCHADALSGPRTFVLLGNQQHLTFVADFVGHVAPDALRELAITQLGLYPYLIDAQPTPGSPEPVTRKSR
jgi:hypothetical protein